MKATQKHIRYLGFVINPAEPAVENLTHTLVNFEENPELWYVINLSASKRDKHIKDSVGRYFRIVFGLSVRAWLIYKTDRKLEKDLKILGDGLIHKKIAAYLREQDRHDKNAGAFKHFPKIRMAIHRSFFFPSGDKKKDNLKILWKGNEKPSRIFFGTSSEFQSVFTCQNQEFICDTIKIKITQPPFTSLDINNLFSLAELCLIMPDVYLWQDLYRKAIYTIPEVNDYIDMHISESISLSSEKKSLELSDSHANQTLQYKDPTAVLKKNTKTLITGRSGSGKTTLFKKLAKKFSSQREYDGNKHVLPVLINLSSFGIEDNTNMIQALCNAICESIQEIPRGELYKWWYHRNKRQPTTLKEVMDDIHREVYEWLDDETNLSNILLLADGFSDINLAFEGALFKELKCFLPKFHGAIVNSQKTISLITELKFDFQYNLKPFTETQMMAFLKKRFPQDEAEIMVDLLEKRHKLFELVKYPFYFRMYCELLEGSNCIDAPAGEGQLIDKFVKYSIKRKMILENVSTVVAPKKLFYAMGCFAKRVLLQIASGGPSYISYPSGFTCESLELSEWEQILQIGEKLGILNSSGQHFDNIHEQQRIRFEHDLFRDYFGAIWLSSMCLNENQSNEFLDEIMEFKIWDNPIKMFFEIADRASMDLDTFVLAIGKYDPYLAANCIDLRDGWKEETIRQILVMLKHWEIDISFDGFKPFSNAGLLATEILLKQIPANKLFLLYQEKQYSLEYIAAPRVLFSNPDMEKKKELLHISSMYDNYPMHLLEGIAKCDDVMAYAAMVEILDDNIISNKVNLQPHLAIQIMRLMFSQAYTPNFKQARLLCEKIKSPFIKQLIYYTSLCSDKELRKMMKDSDPIVRAIASFKLSSSLEKKFADFLLQLEKMEPSNVNNPLLYFLLKITTHTCPKKSDILLINWLDQLTALGSHMPEIFKVTELLIQCNTSFAYQRIAQLLCDSETELVQKVVKGEVDGLVSNSCRHNLTQKLRNVLTDDINSRCLFLIFSLGNELTEAELQKMWELFVDSYKEAIDMYPRLNMEFIFRLTCVTKRSSSIPEVLNLVDQETIQKIAPEQYLMLKFVHKKKILEKMFKSDSEYDYQIAWQMLIDESTCMSLLDFDEVVNLIYDTILAGNLNAVMIKVLWEEIFNAIREGENEAAFKLTYLARVFEKRSKRRWLSIKGANPWEQVSEYFNIKSLIS